MKKRNSGFTIAELLVVIAILAITVSMAVPSFKVLIQDNLLSMQVNNFVNALSVARTEAIKRSNRVTVCKSEDLKTCSKTGTWANGWIVFEDLDNDAAVDKSEEILMVGDQLKGSVTFVGDQGVANYISFVPRGFTRRTNNVVQFGELVLCDNRGFGDKAKGVVVSASGRTRAVPAPQLKLTDCKV